jgi:hypothetical protein
MELERKEFVLLAITVVLAVAGLMVDDILMVAFLLGCAAVLGCYIVLSHPERRLVFKIIGCALIVAISVSAFVRMYGRYQQKELAANEGYLYPADTKSPSTKCPLQRGAISFFLGSNVAQIPMDKINDEIPILNISGEDIIRIAIEYGTIKVTYLEVYDKNGTSIANIHDGKFWLKPELRRKRDDYSRLTLYDEYDKEALEISYVNHSTMLINGYFFDKNGTKIVIRPDKVEYGIFTIAGNCKYMIDNKTPLFTLSNGGLKF